MYAKYKRPVHLQLAKRTSSSGSSADGKLASAMKSPQQSMLRPKRKRVSLAVGDSIVAPSDNVPVATKNSTTASHSRTRSPETEREKVAVIQAGPTAAMDFAQQPPSTDTTTASPAPSNSEPPPSGRTLAAAATSASSPRKSIDPDGDLFDLEDESDNTPHPMGDFESAIESEEDAAPGIAGRIERSTEPEERNEVPVPSPRLEIGESYSYDPEAGLIPQPTAEDTHPTSKTNAAKPDKATHLECRPRTASAASAGFSSSSSQQPTSPGFKRPAVDSDPISRGPDHYCFEGETAAPGVEEETYGSSFSRPPTKGSFTGGSLGESFMAKHAEEMMRSRGGKKELAVR
ncbi:hypothetical protein B0A55_13811 [Friedmanniomyces simplex]|uniref:Uncharacterized protein n=1 Tax=Friedmanniomyces simplex TaxID=329884 RepID=A0A4U0VT26_9PEZI|nr:hypothetical protein B0A55_13811 [Friedmanniomyces simplex]